MGIHEGLIVDSLGIGYSHKSTGRALQAVQKVGVDREGDGNDLLVGGEGLEIGPIGGEGDPEIVGVDVVEEGVG
jgi:hypothetical protein